jgi:hypothetical protein
VTDELKKFSDSELFKEAILKDWNILAGDDAKFNEYINKGHDHMVAYMASKNEIKMMKKEMLTKAARVLIKERYPKTYGYLGEAESMNIFRQMALSNDKQIEEYIGGMTTSGIKYRETARAKFVNDYITKVEEIHAFSKITDEQRGEAILKVGDYYEKKLLSIDDPFSVFEELHKDFSELEQMLITNAENDGRKLEHREEDLLINRATRKVHEMKQYSVKVVKRKAQKSGKGIEDQIEQKLKVESKDLLGEGERKVENIEVETAQTIEVEERSVARDL